MDWLLSQPIHEVRYCLVLEDDACIPADFWERVWQAQVLQDIRRRAMYGSWDIVLLGYFGAKGLRPAHDVEMPTSDSELRLMTVRPGGTFFGTHAYLLSRRGAAILRENVFPMEVQADAYILVLQQLGWLRVYLLDAVHQCLGSTERGIAHQYREDAAALCVSRAGRSALLVVFGVLMLLLILAVLGSLALRRRQSAAEETSL